MGWREVPGPRLVRGLGFCPPLHSMRFALSCGMLASPPSLSAEPQMQPLGPSQCIVQLHVSPNPPNPTNGILWGCGFIAVRGKGALGGGVPAEDGNGKGSGDGTGARGHLQSHQQMG